MAAVVPSAAIEAVNFVEIPEGKWADAANPQNVRVMALRAQLVEMQALWAAVAGAANGDVVAVTAAYDALKAGPKIVNLAGLNTEANVFLGGSRKKRQSKKKKNSKHNNKNNQ
jgi:hypothetical protein